MRKQIFQSLHFNNIMIMFTESLHNVFVIPYVLSFTGESLGTRRIRMGSEEDSTMRNFTVLTVHQLY